MNRPDPIIALAAALVLTALIALVILVLILPG